MLFLTDIFHSICSPFHFFVEEFQNDQWSKADSLTPRTHLYACSLIRMEEGSDLVFQTLNAGACSTAWRRKHM